MAAFRLFEEGEVSMALDMANHYLVPGLKAVGDYPCVGDDEVVEKIREEWCSCLMHPSLPEGEAQCMVVGCVCVYSMFSLSVLCPFIFSNSLPIFFSSVSFKPSSLVLYIYIYM